MAKLTKADVARHLRISRQTLYEWIQKGRISVDPDGTIDSAEVVRLSSSVTHPNVTFARPPGQELTSPQGDTTRELIDVLKAQLAEAQARERFLQDQVDRLTSIIDRRLLEAPRPPAPAAVPPPAAPTRSPPVPAGEDYRGFMRQRVLAALEGFPQGRSKGALEEAVGASKSLTHVLTGMRRDGLLVRLARGRYALPAGAQ